MNGSPLLHALVVATSVGLLWACAEEPSSPPFRPDSPQDWERYLQGTWTHARTDTLRFEDRGVLIGSLSYRLSFRGDTLEVTRTIPGRGSVDVGWATCVVEYGKPYRLKVRACVRVGKYRAWLRDVSPHEEGDTTELGHRTVPPGSPRSRELAEEVAEALPTLRARSPDSLRVTDADGDDYYFTRRRSW